MIKVEQGISKTGVWIEDDFPERSHTMMYISWDKAEEVLEDLSRELGAHYVDSLPRPPQWDDWDEIFFIECPWEDRA